MLMAHYWMFLNHPASTCLVEWGSTMMELGEFVRLQLSELFVERRVIVVASFELLAAACEFWDREADRMGEAREVDAHQDPAAQDLIRRQRPRVRV